MKPSVKTTGLEEKDILQEKIGARGRAGGFALALGRSSGSRTGRGSASSCLPRQAKLLPSLSPGCQGCQGIALVDLPTGCLSHPCPKLDRLEVPTRQPKAASSGKDVLSRQPTREGRQCHSPTAGRAPGSPVPRWSSPCLVPVMACPPPSCLRSQLWWARAFPLSLMRPTSAITWKRQSKRSFVGRSGFTPHHVLQRSL